MSHVLGRDLVRDVLPLCGRVEWETDLYGLHPSGGWASCLPVDDSKNVSTKEDYQIIHRDFYKKNIT